MPTMVSISEVLAGICPTRMERVGVVGDPAGQHQAQTAVPEAAYQATFSSRALSLASDAASASAMSARDDIVRGVEVKPGTHATLEALLPNKHSSGELSTHFADFLLQGANEVNEEKYQLVETFGDPIIFLFGERPKIYQYSGTLLNTKDYAWRDGWKIKYANELRGTECVRLKKRAYLTYDYVLREGYLLGMSIGQIAANPNHVDFSFTMFITKEINLRPKDVQDRKDKKDKANQKKADRDKALAALSAPARDLLAFKDFLGQKLAARSLDGSSLSTAAIKGIGVDAAAVNGGGLV